MKTFIKYLIFLLTPHLFFDWIKYLLSKKDVALAQSLKGEKNVYVFLGCDYANLGDCAITIAQKKMLERIFPGRRVRVFYMDETYSALKTVVANKEYGDIVTLIGGGNMGDLYYGYERKRNFIVRKLRKYRIISFPQTVSFSLSPLGRLALKRSVKIYSQHPNLTILAREKMSYEKMKSLFVNNVVRLTPDIVMTLDYPFEQTREGVTISFRHDKEALLSEANKNAVVEFAKTIGLVSFYDTCSAKFNDLQESFDDLLKSYASSKLVVTDRLHGMIFAYITGTPALVFLNNNGKILHCYEWIKHCGYVKLVNCIDDNCLKQVCNEIDLNRKYRCDAEPLKSYFANL